MEHRTQRENRRQSSQRSWWARRRTAWISAGAVLGLMVLTAIVTPLGSRLVEQIWPSETSGTGGGGPPIPESPSGSPAGRLVAIGSWPPESSFMCESSTKVAGLPGSSGPEGLKPEDNEDLRVAAIKNVGALVWYHGKLSITLTTVDETPVLIMGIEPVVFAKQQVEPAWGLEVSPGCGGPSQVRLLRSVLDRGTVEDLCVAEYGPGKPRAPREPLGPTFTVNNADAADLQLEINACEGLYEFGVKITYVEAGQTKAAWIGSAENPFRIVGGWRNVERFHSMVSSSGSQSGIRPDPMPLYPGATAADGVPATMTEFCA